MIQIARFRIGLEMAPPDELQGVVQFYFLSLYSNILVLVYNSCTGVMISSIHVLLFIFALFIILIYNVIVCHVIIRLIIIRLENISIIRKNVCGILGILLRLESNFYWIE